MIHFNALPHEVRVALLTRKNGDTKAGYRFPQPGTTTTVLVTLLLIWIVALLAATYLLVGHSKLLVLQAILVALVGWTMIAIYRKYRQYKDPEFPGHCIFLDGSHFYLVKGHRVRAIRLDEVQKVSAFTRDKIHYLHLASQNFQANLKMKTYLNRQRTLDLARWVARTKAFRDALPAEVKARASGTKIWVAMQAFNQSRDPKVLHGLLANTAPPDAARAEGETTVRSHPQTYVTRKHWITLACVLGVLAVGGRSCNGLVQETKLYNQAKQSSSSAACAAYLSEFPRGRFSEQVSELLDHREFAAAKRTLRHENRLGPMRAYLERHSIHSDEGVALINDRYDAVFQKLEAKNGVLSQGLKRIVEKRKFDEFPIVSVMIDGRHDLCQNKRDFLALEQQVVSVRTKDISLNAGGKDFLPNSLIVDPHPAFSTSELKHRANLVKSRLEYGFNQGLGRELLSLQIVDSEAAADLVVRYEIKGSPFPYLYSMNHKPVGMLRNFDVNWTLKFRPLEKDQKTLEWKTRSEPSPQLVSNSRKKLPPWTAYGVIIYSSFYGFSNDVLQGFGLPMEDPPKTFYSDQATSKYGREQWEIAQEIERIQQTKAANAFATEIQRMKAGGVEVEIQHMKADAFEMELQRMIEKAVESTKELHSENPGAE